MEAPMYEPTTLGAQALEAPQPEMTEEAQPISNEMLVDGEIASMILTRKEASRVWRQSKLEIWNQCWNHYKQIYDRTNKEAWQAGTFIPASPKVAEVITSNMHSALLSPEKPVEYQARQPAFEQPVRDANDLLSVDMERSEFKVHWTDILRTTCIIGTGIGKVEYKKEHATVTIKERVKPNPLMDSMRRMMGFGPAPTETTRQERKLVKDYSTTCAVDPYNCYPEPGSIEIDKDHWFIEEGKICNYKLIELANDQDNPVRNITPELLSSGPANPDSNGEKQDKEIALDEPVKPTAYLDPDREHRLDEYWGPAPIWMVQPELYGKEEHQYTMVNAWFWLIDGIYVVRAQVTPFRDAEPPYVKSVYIRVPGQFWGIGPLELIMHLQVELNERVNTQQDEINLKLSKPIAVIKSMVASGEWGRLVSGPGALWVFDNVDDIKKAFQTIEFDANLGDSWRAIQWLLNEIQEASAAVKAVVGNDGGGGQDEAGTFRGQMLNKQVASERFIMYARIMEVTGLGKAYRKHYHRIYQFKDWKDAEQILGPIRAQKFEFISPEDLDVMAKVVPMGVTSMENKGVQLAQMGEEFRMFSQFPWYKQVEAARRMVVQRGQADSDAVIMSDEELGILNQERQRMISEAGVPPGQPGMGGPDMPPSGPIAGGMPGPTDGLATPPMPARGPGASPMDLNGRPVA
jgi:hypothetical protein